MIKFKCLLSLLFIFFPHTFCYADKGIFSPKVTPDEIYITVMPSTIRVTAEIGDIPMNEILVHIYETNIKGSHPKLLCKMYNDGTNGDKKKDSYYTGQFVLNRHLKTEVYFKIIAEYNAKDTFESSVLKVSVFEPLPDEMIGDLNKDLKILQKNFFIYLQSNNLSTARKMVLTDAQRNPSITSADLYGRNLGILYKGQVRGMLLLDDPNAEPVDGMK